MLTTRDGPAVIDIGRKSRLLTQLGGPHRNITTTFGTEN